MCGIAGIISFSSTSFQLPSLLHNMTNAIRHRGPDDEGYAFFAPEGELQAYGQDTPEELKRRLHNIHHVPDHFSVALGHRRLSILDISAAGHQPMQYAEGNYWITYNGEIYNYLALRDELEKLGYNFKTQTDTEVLLAAYAAWGTNLLSKLNGMWSFVILDKTRNILFGARDRFGVKPFYYSHRNNLFSFASEYKALLTLPFIDKKLNDKIVFDYLALGVSEPEEDTIFANIRELLPSCAFTLDLSSQQFNKWQYYTLPYENQWHAFDPAKAKTYEQDIRDLLIKAVEGRLQTDVAIGSCLSGGIDSSSIVSIVDTLMKGKSYAQLGGSQKIFTAAFPGSHIDETQWAAKVAEQTNTSWYKTSPSSADLLANLETVVRAQDIPFLGSSTFAQFSVMKLVHANGVKVTLDGQGADELFSGYSPHYVSYIGELARQKQLKHMFNNLGAAQSNFANNQHALKWPFKLFTAKLFKSHFTQTTYRKSAGITDFLQGDLWRNYSKRVEVLLQKPSCNLNDTLHWEFCGPHLKVLMRTADRNAMHFSVESRVPFADDLPLIEYVFRIPSVYKIRNATSKVLLRNAMQGILHEQVRTRQDKLGFSTPELHWLTNIHQEVGHYFTNDLEEYIDVRKLKQEWADLFKNNYQGETTRLWRLINFAVWKKVFDL